MSNSLNKIKHVDERVIKFINGYLKEIGSLSRPNVNIPDLVTNICIHFYYQRMGFSLMVYKSPEYFTYEAYRMDCIVISNDKFTAQGRKLGGREGTVFGNIIIDSTNPIICQWTVKVTDADESRLKNFIYVGLYGGTHHQHLKDHNPPKYTFLANGCGGVCTFHEYRISHKWRKLCKHRWKNNDIVSIKLNLRRRNIEYSVNGESIGTAFANIPIGEDIKYRFAATLYKNRKVVMHNFERLCGVKYLKSLELRI